MLADAEGSVRQQEVVAAKPLVNQLMWAQLWLVSPADMPLWQGISEEA